MVYMILNRCMVSLPIDGKQRKTTMTAIKNIIDVAFLSAWIFATYVLFIA